MKKRRTWIIIFVVVLLLAGGGIYFATRPATTGRTGVSQFLANATTAKVTRTNLMTSVDTSGSVIPDSKVQLSFGTAGTVNQVKVVAGDKVKKGDVLATLDTTDLQLKVAQAQQSYLSQQTTYSSTVHPDPSQVAVAQASYNSALASYNAARQSYSNLTLQQTTQCAQLTSAQNALQIAQTAYDRLANDHQAKNYLSSDWGPFQSVVNNLTNAQSAYDLAVANCDIAKTGLNDSSLRAAEAQIQTAKTNLDELIAPLAEKQIQAAAQLEQARLSLVQAQQNLANATIVAPLDGVVTAVNVVTGGLSSGVAIEMADMSKLHVDVLVDETQIASVQLGQKVDVTLDALTGITVTGKVGRIDPAGTISQGVVNYNVQVDLDPTNAPLRLDMTANASIIAATRENVLAVPNAAVRTAGFGGQGGFSGQGGSSGQGGAGGQGGFTGQGGGGNRQGGQGGANGQGSQGGQQRVQGPFVLVIRNGQPVTVPVTVGLVASDLTEVSGDVQEGDVVVVSNGTTRTTTAAPAGGGFGGFRGFPGD